MDFVLNFILIKGSEICALIPYCGDKDSIEHTFIECLFTRSFAKNVIQWFNGANCCQISPTPRELLFGITPGTKGTKIIKKLSTLPYLCAITYIQTKSIVMHLNARIHQ